VSRIKDWIFDMEDDAIDMSRDVFIRVYGISNVDIWDRIHREQEMEYPDEESYYGKS